MKIYTDDTHEAKFLLVECADEGDTFEDRMIDGIDLPTLMKPVSCSDEILRYDISGYRTIEEALKNRCLKKDEITDILLSVDTAIKYLEERMLSDANILLDPSYVFTGGNGRNVIFPVSRSSVGRFPERMRKLSELLFRHADFNDEAALRFAAGLMKICLSDDFRMHDIMHFVERSRRESGRVQAPKPAPPAESVSAGAAVSALPALPAVSAFETAAEQQLFEKEITAGTKELPDMKGKKTRLIFLAGALAVSLLDVLCMFLGNSKALKLLPLLLAVSAAAAGYNIYAAYKEKENT